MQVSCLCSCLRKNSKRTVKEHLKRLRELANVAKETPDDARPLETFEIVDMFFRMMPLKWQTKFHEARADQIDMTFDQSCYYFERLGMIEAQEGGANEKRHNKMGKESRHIVAKRINDEKQKKFFKNCNGNGSL